MPLSSESSSNVCVCVGGGRWSFCGITPLPTLLHKLMLVFVVNPVTWGGGLAEERDLARSDCRVTRLHKTERRGHLGSYPTMASWALLLLALELLATPGKDITLSADPGSSLHPHQLSRCHHKRFSLRARDSPSLLVTRLMREASGKEGSPGRFRY